MIVSSAPGRVDLFNTHQDYKGLPVIPAAVDLRTYVEGELRMGNVVKVRSVNMGEEVELRVDDKLSVGSWSSYVLAALKVLSMHGYYIGGAELTIRSDVPIGSGLASSAALLVAVVNWFNKAYGLGLSRRDIAEFAYEAEHNVMGIPCGRLDQYSSSYGGLIILETRPPYRVEELGVKGLDFIVVDSGVRHSTMNVHTVRQRELREALSMLRESMPREYWGELSKPLDEVNWDLIANATKDYLSTLDDTHRKRLEFTILMNESTKRAIAELRKGEPDRRVLGEIMNEQHRLLRDLYEVSIPELEEIKRHLDSNGALGSKISGAGMGGSMVALAESREDAKRIVESIKGRWRAWVVSIDQGVS